MFPKLQFRHASPGDDAFESTDSGAGFNLGLILLAAAVVLLLTSLLLGKD